MLDRPISFDLFTAIGAAMIPVIFAFGGWQTASFIADEVREPAKNLPRALLLGVTGVIILYLSVNFVDVRVLGAAGLAQTAVPASAVMRAAVGERGAVIIAAGIALSALGFLSQSILTAPRVYFAMARDGIFFKSVAWLHPRTHVPVVAIALQGLWAIVITLSGNYEQILNYFRRDGLPFLRPQRDVHICFSRTRCARDYQWRLRPGESARVSRARPPVDDWLVHHCLLVGGRKFVLQISYEQSDRRGDRRRRHSVIFPLGERAARETRTQHERTAQHHGVALHGVGQDLFARAL